MTYNTSIPQESNHPPSAGAAIAEGGLVADQSNRRDSFPKENTPILAEIICDFNMTDSGNGERFEILHGNRAHYNPDRGKWLVWIGKVWKWDSGAIVREWALDTMREVINQANQLADTSKRNDLIKFALKSESIRSLDAMLIAAQNKQHIPIELEQLDANPMLLNVQNGTIDLTTGKLWPHNPKDLITKLINIEYKPTKSQVWQDFLTKIFNGDTD